MLLSRRMAVTRQLLSPVGVALALVAGALFFGGSAGSGSIPWLGRRGDRRGRRARGHPRASEAHGRAASARRPRRVVRGLGRMVDRAGPLVDTRIEASSYLAFAVVGAYVGGRSGELALGLAALLGAVCVWALTLKVVPGLYDDYGRVARLRAPIGYWNALALLGAIALPLGLWLAGRRRSAGTLLVYGWMVAIALTYSRGGVAVAVIVVLAWILLSGAWIAGSTALVAAGIPAAVVIIAALSLEGVTSDAQSHSTRVHDGLIFGAALVAGAVVAALLARLPLPESTRALRVSAFALVAVIAAIALAVGAAHAHTWWNQFTSPAAAEVSNSQSRFVEAGSNHRWEWWQQGWNAFEDHPLAGTGAGSFGFTNLRYRTTSLDSTTEPHNLPVQFLTETGAVGAVLFVRRSADARRVRAAAKRRRARPLARAAGVPAARPARHRLGLHRGHGAGLPDRRRAGRGRRAETAALLASGRARRRRRRGRRAPLALHGLARRPVREPGRAREQAGAGDRPGQARPLARPVRGRSALHAGARRAGAEAPQAAPAGCS